MISISIKNQQELVEIDYAPLKAAAKAVFEGEGVPSAKVTFAFFDNPTIHAMNLRHLNHDEPTDVLTFPYSVRGAARLEGDVAIGAHVAKAEAEERGHSVLTELCLYVIHGCLHLCGYNDKKPQDAKEMRAKEREYLAKLNLPDVVEDGDEE
jgi:probable rRNA maturation factor